MSEHSEFSVYQWFHPMAGDQHECVKQYVGPEEAVQCAKSLITSVGGRLGTTCRVIITDGGDCINFEWEFGKGVTYPKREEVINQ